MTFADRFADDEDPLLQQMLAARAWGVSPRRFLGWEPARVTTHEYDAAGRPVRSVTMAEPEWSAEDREMAMAFAAYEAGLCSGCRHELAITTQPEMEDAYIPEPAIRCHRCTASMRAAAVYEQSDHPGALMIPLRLRST